MGVLSYSNVHVYVSSVTFKILAITLPIPYGSTKEMREDGKVFNLFLND